MKSIHSLHSYPFCSLATNHLQFMFIRASACNWNERKLVLYMIHTHLFWCWVILIRFDSEYCYISNTQQSRLFTTTSTTYLTPVPQSTIEIEKIQMNTKPPTPVDQSNRRLNEAQTSSSTPPHSLSRLTTTTTNLIQQQQQKQPIRRRRQSSLIQFISPSSPSILITPHIFCRLQPANFFNLIFHRIGFAPSLRDFSQSMASRREIIYISDYSSPDSHGRSRLTIIQSRRNHKRRQRHRERWPLPLPINIDGECGICLETYREDNMIVTLMCHHHHHFHRHCIDVGCKQERVAQFVGELLKYHWEWDFLEDW